MNNKVRIMKSNGGNIHCWVIRDFDILNSVFVNLRFNWLRVSPAVAGKRSGRSCADANGAG